MGNHFYGWDGSNVSTHIRNVAWDLLFIKLKKGFYYFKKIEANSPIIICINYILNVDV